MNGGNGITGGSGENPVGIRLPVFDPEVQMGEENDIRTVNTLTGIFFLFPAAYAKENSSHQ